MASLLYVESARQYNSDMAAIHCELTLPGHGISVLNRLVHAQSGRELTKLKLDTVIRMLESGTVDEDGNVYRLPRKTEIRLCTSDQFLIDCIQDYFNAQRETKENVGKTRFRNGRQCKRLWEILSNGEHVLTFDNNALLTKMMQSEAKEHLRNKST